MLKYLLNSEKNEISMFSNLRDVEPFILRKE